MLVNKDFAFIHFPKTAGKSLTKYMISAWEGPIFGRVSPGQIKEVADVLRPDVRLEVGRGHENMRRTSLILESMGRDIHNLRAIFVCIRNPYDLAVSTYFFLRRTYAENGGSERFRMASAMGFSEFWCKDISTSPPERWLTLGGEVLPNQHFIRFESLREDLGFLSRKFGFKDAVLPHLNSTTHGHYSEYMTKESEEAVYTRFRYLFDAGHYERESFDLGQPDGSWRGHLG